MILPTSHRRFVRSGIQRQCVGAPSGATLECSSYSFRTNCRFRPAGRNESRRGTSARQQP